MASEAYLIIHPYPLTNPTITGNGYTLTPSAGNNCYYYSGIPAGTWTISADGYNSASVTVTGTSYTDEYNVTLTDMPLNLYGWTDSNTTLYAWTNPNTNVTCYTTTSTPSTNSPLVLYDKNGDIFNHNHGDLINGISAADSNSITIETES